MSAPLVDAEALSALRASMKPAQFRHLLGLVAKDLASRLGALHAARDPLDRGRIAVEAHQLRGSAATIGAQALAEATQALEDMAPAAPPDAIGAALDAFIALAGQTRAELDRQTADNA